MLLSLNVLFLGLSLLVVIDATPVKLDEATSKIIETSYNHSPPPPSNDSLESEESTEEEEGPGPHHPISPSSKLNAFSFPTKPSKWIDSLESVESNEVEESDSLARHQHLPTPPPPPSAVDVVKMLTDLDLL